MLRDALNEEAPALRGRERLEQPGDEVVASAKLEGESRAFSIFAATLWDNQHEKAFVVGPKSLTQGITATKGSCARSSAAEQSNDEGPILEERGISHFPIMIAIWPSRQRQYGGAWRHNFLIDKSSKVRVGVPAMPPPTDAKIE